MDRRFTQMDSISLLGPPQPKQPLNQEDFDSRFGLIKKRKITGGGQLSKTLTVGIKSAKRIPIPFFRWLRWYNFREEASRDALGSLLLSALLLPQGLFVGLLMDDLGGGVLSLLIPQLMYCLLGSGRHSSLGSLSYASILIYTSLKNTNSSLATLTTYIGFMQLAVFLLPTQRVFSLFSTQLLTGFNLGLLVRFLISCLSRFVPISGCSYVNLCIDDFINCFFATHWPSALLALAALSLSLLFHLKLNVLSKERLGFTLPHELFIIFSLSLLCAQFGFNDPLPTKTSTIFDTSRISAPGLPSLGILLDSLAISLFGAAIHIHSMQDSKTNNLNKKQELLVLCLCSLFSAPFSLPSPFSSPRNSQFNSEAMKRSLLSNLISILLLLVGCVVLFFTLQYIPTPVIAALALSTFTNLPSDIRYLSSLAKKSPSDLLIAIMAFLCAVAFPNSCHGFLASILFSLLHVATHVQSTSSEVLIKVSENFYVEEDRYREMECPDTPLRILRLSGPLIFLNCLQFRKAIYEQVTVVKGLIGVGLGSRTVSLRSCGGPGAIGPRESVTGRSATNIIITHDSDQPSLPTGDHIYRFIVLDLQGVTKIDTEAILVLTQVFGELGSDHIRLLFVGLSASVRDQLERCEVYNMIPLSHFYPNLNEALTAARNISLPFHMSVSMNGYRDVIALSTPGSNLDISISRYSPEAI